MHIHTFVESYKAFRKEPMKKYVFASLLVTSGWAYGQSCVTPAAVPAGASVLGYNTQLFYDSPTLNEVSARFRVMDPPDFV